MAPEELLESLNILAQYIDENPKPSISLVASTIEKIALSVETGDEFHRIASLRQIHAGIFDMFKSKGEKDIIRKIERLKKLQKLIPKVLKVVRSGEDLTPIAEKDEEGEVLYLAVINADESKVSDKFKRDAADLDPDGIGLFAKGIDEYWDDEGDDYKSDDRKALIRSFTKVDKEISSKIGKLEDQLEEASKEVKKGGALEKGEKTEFYKKEGGKWVPLYEDDIDEIGPKAKKLMDGVKEFKELYDERTEDEVKELESMRKNLVKTMESLNVYPTGKHPVWDTVEPKTISKGERGEPEESKAESKKSESETSNKDKLLKMKEEATRKKEELEKELSIIEDELKKGEPAPESKVAPKATPKAAPVKKRR